MIILIIFYFETFNMGTKWMPIQGLGQFISYFLFSKTMGEIVGTFNSTFQEPGIGGRLKAANAALTFFSCLIYLVSYLLILWPFYRYFVLRQESSDTIYKLEEEASQQRRQDSKRFRYYGLIVLAILICLGIVWAICNRLKYKN